MSLYVIGANMPRCCAECYFNQKWSFLTESYCDIKKIANEASEFSFDRPNWCPLVELNIPIIEGVNNESNEM